MSFKTRHTLSDTTSDSTGIGAARRWIYKKMESYSKRSGGRLQVRYQSYKQPAKEQDRVDKPTKIVNVSNYSVSSLDNILPKSPI